MLSERSSLKLAMASLALTAVVVRFDNSPASVAPTILALDDLRDAVGSGAADDKADAVAAFFGRYDADLKKLGVKTGDAWFLSDDAVARLKQALGSIVDADASKLKIFIDPESKAGLIGDYVLGTTGNPDEGFVVGRTGRRVILPRVVQCAILVDDGKRIPLGVYYRDGYKLMAGTETCEGEIHRQRNLYGTIMESNVLCPDGKKWSVTGDSRSLRINGVAAVSF